ncbi:MAG: glycosyltransferase family 4 protein [Aigarchaeota archaeon]|nr:glycosyltransferase family 4 protein [Aigarchaeota archaeon]MCS7127547.1 glycosyltransferase family 4 protein [Candidatus Calditenuaceae archaeon]MDW8043598.1 glycosyltransferase family 4 protein [Nitrososphaerota archaeon]
MAVVPARGGLTGASMALVNALLGLVRLYGALVRVTVVTSYSALKYPTLEKLVKAGATCHAVKVEGLPAPFYWLLLGMKLILSGRHDVAHFSTPKALFLLYPAARLAARRVVLTLEGYPPYELEGTSAGSRLLGTAAWSACLRLADRIATCSDWLRSVVESRRGFGFKMVTVHNPIDFERFGDNGPSDGPLVIVARLHKVKGVDVAIRALAYLARSSRDVPKLVIVGDGPERRELESLCRELGVDHLVEFLGHRSDPERWVKSASVVLVPSRYEPFGMPAAEAGAAGKPVVASATGGLREIVVDGVTGLLSRPDDHTDLATKIQRLMSDEEVRRRMGQAARARVFRSFTPEAIAPRLMNLYLDALRS